MRRITVACAGVGLLVTATVALGANVARLVTGKHLSQAQQVRKSESSSSRKRSGHRSKKTSAKNLARSTKKALRTQKSTTASISSLQPMAAAFAATSSPTLLGDQTVEALVDSNDAGQPEAF